MADPDEIAQAYERGQRDMRNRIEKHFTHYSMSPMNAAARPYLKARKLRGTVGLDIRRNCKIIPLSEVHLKAGRTRG